MAPKPYDAKGYAELKEMTREELIQQHDLLTAKVKVGINYYLEEIHRREVEEINRQMLKHTRDVRNLTKAIAILTVINVVAVAWGIVVSVVSVVVSIASIFL